MKYPQLFLFFHAVPESKTESPSGEATLSRSGIRGSVHRGDEGNVQCSDVSETVGASGCCRFRGFGRVACHSLFRTPQSVAKRKSVSASSAYHT